MEQIQLQATTNLYIYTSIHLYIYTHIHPYIDTLIQLCMDRTIHSYIDAYVHMYVRTCTYGLILKDMCIYIYVQIYILSRFNSFASFARLR